MIDTSHKPCVYLMRYRTADGMIHKIGRSVDLLNRVSYYPPKLRVLLLSAYCPLDVESEEARLLTKYSAFALDIGHYGYERFRFSHSTEDEIVKFMHSQTDKRKFFTVEAYFIKRNAQISLNS